MRILFSLLTVVLILGAGLTFVAMPATAGDPVYPDLRSAQPYNIYISRERVNGTYRYRLRFSNQIRNYGGPLEITANLNTSRNLYQNVYDSRIGGSVVRRERVASDLIYHPSHNHFHFQDFASYELLKKNSAGQYKETGKAGNKTSYCILDYQRILSGARSSARYSTCNATRQGMSYGWADTYYAELPGQYIDLGTSRPADGDYAILTTADPDNKLMESNNGNNAAVRYIRISGGRVVNSNQSPSCTISPVTVKVGDTTSISCTRLSPGTVLDLKWGSSSGASLGSMTVSDENKAIRQFVVPSASRGVHHVYVKVRGSSSTYTAVVTIQPDIDLSPSAGANYATVNFALFGFGAGERVNIRFFRTSSSSTEVASIVVSSKGAAAGSFAVPLSPGLSHKVEAKGAQTGSTNSETFYVMATLNLTESSGAPGSSLKPWLRGFAANESVDLRLGPGGPVLKTVTVTSYGKLDWADSNTEFEIPDDAEAGPVQIVATGRTSNLSASRSFTVIGVQPAAQEPTATATVTPSATSELPPESTSTNHPTPTETLAPVPTATATDVPPAATDEPTGAPTEIPTEAPTETLQPTETPTEEPPPETP